MFDRTPDIFQIYYYAESKTYLCINQDTFCHCCGGLHDGITYSESAKRVLSKNKSHFDINSKGIRFKMLGNFCGTKVYPEHGYLPLPIELSIIFGVTDSMFLQGDIGMSRAYYILEGKRNLRIVSAKGNGYMWCDRKKIVVGDRTNLYSESYC